MPGYAVIYARHSPRPGVTDSCNAQIKMCRDYCRLHELEIAGEYKDEGISGASDQRPGLDLAMAAAIKTRAALVVYSLSRFARSTKQAIELSERLNKRHANLVCIKESFDTQTAMGKFVFTIFSAIAELEREQIRERTSDTMRKYQQEGRRMGRADQTPFGWHLDPRDPARMREDKSEQRVIQQMLLLREGGMTLRGIAAELLKRNVKCRGNKYWHHSTVSKILTRSANTPPS